MTIEGWPTWSELDLRKSDEELARHWPEELTIQNAVDLLELGKSASGILLACQQGRIKANYWLSPSGKRYWSIPGVNLIAWARLRPERAPRERWAAEPVVAKRAPGRPRTRADEAQTPARRRSAANYA